jgi:hypothetical protein
MEVLDDNLFESKSKERHGCVAAWLIMMIVVNTLGSIGYIFMGEFIYDAFPKGINQVGLIIYAILTSANVVFAVMLFKWMRIGFWGYVGTSILASIMNISLGLGIVQSMLGFVGILALYGVLQIQQKNLSAWSQLD